MVYATRLHLCSFGDKMSRMSGNDRMTGCGRVLVKVTQDPLSPLPLLELAQLALLLKQRVEALESTQRAMEIRIATLERAQQEG